MGKFSRTAALPRSPITSIAEPGVRTANGAVGYVRDAKSELFLLAVANMVGEKTYHEDANGRDARFAGLVHQVTQDDPGWVARLIPWLRNEANMRSASIVAAAEYCAVPGAPNRREVVNSAMSRADEPAEFVAYWMKNVKRALSGGVQRGLRDAILRLYNERSVMRYDGNNNAYRMGDVIELVHPKPKAVWQSALFKYLLDGRHHADEDKVVAQFWLDSVSVGMDGSGVAGRYVLPLLKQYHELMKVPQSERRAHLDDAVKVLSWEALSGWLNGPMDKEAWQAIIPEMGYMALLRNLRNFDQAGINDDAIDYVEAKLRNPDEVARSRQLPMRFFSAWKAINSVTWGRSLERALDLSLQNVPTMRGHTLVLVDLSDSMHATMSEHGTAQRWEIAAIFGAAIAKRNQSTIVIYSNEGAKVHIGKDASILRAVEQMSRWDGAWHGTYTWKVLSSVFNANEHDRIIILTDEQANADAYATALPTVPLYVFNLAGYKTGSIPSGKDNKYVFGGLNDQAFTMLPMLEARRDAKWPF